MCSVWTTFLTTDSQFYICMWSSGSLHCQDVLSCYLRLFINHHSEPLQLQITLLSQHLGMLALNHHLVPACAKAKPTVTADCLKQKVHFNLLKFSYLVLPPVFFFFFTKAPDYLLEATFMSSCWQKWLLSSCKHFHKCKEVCQVL